MIMPKGKNEAVGDFDPGRGEEKRSHNAHDPT